MIAEDFYRSLLMKEVTRETEWLDLGCGWQILRSWLPNGEADQAELSRRARRLVGIDAVPDNISRNRYLHEKFVGDICALPFPNASFNLVTAQMVVEHLKRPRELLREVRRVLRPGGKFIFITPNYLNYQIFAASLFPDGLKKRIIYCLEGRSESDVFKTYYRMNTRERVLRLACRTGFSVQAIHMLHADWEFRTIPGLRSIEKIMQRVLDMETFSTFRTDILAVLIQSGC